MARLVVAAAGAALGSMAGPLGAKLGWMAGAMLGGALFKPDPTQGPRVEDKKISASTYGETIPIMWGTDRCKAQFIWSSDLIEAEQDVGGGKGFGGAEGVVYTYSVNVLISVCRSKGTHTPLKLFGNGRLIWEHDGSARGKVDKALIQPGNVRWYNGAADQMPDPVYEAAVGVENAPAYRGQLSIMLEGLQLGDFGNRPPNFEVVVTDNVTVEGCADEIIRYTKHQHAQQVELAPAWSDGQMTGALDAEKQVYYAISRTSESGTYYLDAYDVSGDVPLLQWSHSLNTFWPLMSDTINGGFVVTGMVFDPVNRLLWMVGGGPVSSNGYPVAVIYEPDFALFRLSNARVVWEYKPPVYIAHGCAAWDYPFHDGAHGAAGMRFECTLTPITGTSPAGGRGGVIVHYAGSGFVGGFSLYNDGSHYGRYHPTGGLSGIILSHFIPPADGVRSLNYAAHWGVGYPTAVYDDTGALVGVPDVPTGHGGAGTSTQIQLAHSATRKRLYVMAGLEIAEIDISTTGNPLRYVKNFSPVDIPDTLGSGFTGRLTYDEDLDVLVAIGTHNFNANVSVYHLDPETYEQVHHCLRPLQDGQTHGAPGHIWPLAGGRYVTSMLGMAFDKGATGGVAILRGPGGTAYGGPALLSRIVSEVCTHPAIGLTDIDVSALTDEVPGFTVARQAAARGIIDTLAQAWFFYGVESGDKSVFRKHGGASVATIESGELGAHVFQLTQSEPEPPYELEHIDEIEAPRQLTVKYIDSTANYDPGTQLAARQVGGSLSPATLDLPIVLGTDYAAQVAWTHLVRQHAGKRPIRLKLSHAYEAIEPGDPITVPLASGESARVVVANRVSARPLVELDGVLEDGAVWDAIFPGVDRGQLPRQDAPAELFATVLELMDLPPLRAEDDRLVVYAAVSRATGNNWPGAAVYKSVDGGATYLQQYSATTEATAGFLLTPLPAWTRGNRWDRTSTFRVRLRRGTLSSATEEGVLNGMNVAAVGNEIIQFANASLVDTDTWELSTLLRHRVGTEWAAEEGHATGTRFVLLSTAALRAIEYALGDLSLTSNWKAVTAGLAVADAAATSFNAAGNSIRPLSPVHVRGMRDGGGDLAVTWIGRARVNAEWRDEFDVPLDESSEQYRVIVYSDADRTTVVRTEDVTAPAWSYSAADQASDFGSAQATVILDVHQLSPTYNALGHPAEVAL